MAEQAEIFSHHSPYRHRVRATILLDAGLLTSARTIVAVAHFAWSTKAARSPAGDPVLAHAGHPDPAARVRHAVADLRAIFERPAALRLFEDHCAKVASFPRRLDHHRRPGVRVVQPVGSAPGPGLQTAGDAVNQACRDFERQCGPVASIAGKEREKPAHFAEVAPLNVVKDALDLQVAALILGSYIATAPRCFCERPHARTGWPLGHSGAAQGGRGAAFWPVWVVVLPAWLGCCLLDGLRVEVELA